MRRKIIDRETSYSSKKTAKSFIHQMSNKSKDDDVTCDARVLIAKRCHTDP